MSATQMCAFAGCDAVDSVFTSVGELRDDQQFCLSRRSGQEIHSGVICEKHRRRYLNDYVKVYSRKSCSDPRNAHHRRVKGTCTIDIELARRYETLIPGEKLCVSCFQHLHAEKFSSQSDAQSYQPPCSQEKIDALETTNDVLRLVGVSPVKSKRKNSTHLAEEVSGKLAKLNDALRGSRSSYSGPPVTAGDFETLLSMARTRFPGLGKREKLQMLTVKPPSWSSKQTADFFGCSLRMVKQAKLLSKNEGFLALPDKKYGNSLASDMVEKAQRFYEEDGVSRMTSGTRDVLKGHQKRNLLLTLKEAYALFKAENPMGKIGISSFCALRPAWCVLYGNNRSPTDSCLCVYHENAKLLLSETCPGTPCSEAISLMVCDIEREECMLTETCEKCPGEEALRQLLLMLDCFQDEADGVTYRQWKRTPGQQFSISLATLMECGHVVLDRLVNQLVELKHHDFIKRAQSKYLKDLKLLFSPDEAILLVDFSENFTFNIPQEVQAAHFCRKQATIHPFVLYYKDSANQVVPHVRSFVAISDTDVHDADSFHALLKRFFEKARSEMLLDGVAKIHVFSDGAPSQYKNWKNLLNLIFFQEDFDCQVEWNFCASGHGKGACDAVGAAFKRAAGNENNHRDARSALRSPQELFAWAESPGRHLTSMPFYVSHDDVVKCKVQLSERQSRYGKKLRGVSQFHCFRPESNHRIFASRTSYSLQSSVLSFNAA
jgi:hypothetical protein